MFTILSSKVTKMRPKASCTYWKTYQINPCPTQFRKDSRTAKQLSTGHSGRESTDSRDLVIISAILCPSQNGILSRYFFFINIHLPKANANHSWTSSSSEWAVNLSGCSIPERVVITYPGDRKHTRQVSHVYSCSYIVKCLHWTKKYSR